MTANAGLSPDDWHEIKRLVDAAIDLEAEARETYLRDACPDNGPIRSAVEALLARARLGAIEERPGRAAEFVSTRRSRDRTHTLADVAGKERRVGSYRLVKKIGSGGMGDVYYAVREGDFVQHVAIKLLRRAVAADQLQRFNNERQILAAVEHPNIAKLLDGGTSTEGDPYLVLEFIEGKPILEHCDQARFSISERLQLFRKVCAAVHFAHQNLVVHRDIKPSNIVVTNEGEPKLLDFGIAKLMSPLMGVQAVDITRTDQRLMTPKYASPEQISGESISTASDVYSLGVLLYELLTGRHPYRFENESQREFIDVVCNRPHKRPSAIIERFEPGTVADVLPDASSLSELRRTTPLKLRRLLQGDLDNIVLKAMRREPRDRYSSAADLSEDIRRFLDGLPVNASRGTLWYRCRKFVSRHRAGALAAALVAFALSAGIIGTSVGLLRARKAERLASSEAEAANQVTRFLVSLFQVSDPSEARGNVITAREILEQGAARVDTELASQPAVQARLMDTMGTVFLNLGLYDRARPLLEAAVERRERTLGGDSPLLAESLTHLANAYRDQAHFEEAERLYARALRIYESALAPDDPRIATTLHDFNRLALLYQNEDRYTQAETIYKRVLAIRTASVGDNHPDVAETFSDLGVLYRFQGKFDEAESLFERALGIYERRFGTDHPDVGRVFNHLGLLYDSQERYEDAVAAFRRALDVYEKVEPNHPYIATILHNWSATNSKQERYSEAELLADRALQILESAFSADHPNVGRTLNNLSFLYMKQNRYDEAEVALVRALDIFERAMGSDHPVTNAVRDNLAELREQR